MMKPARARFASSRRIDLTVAVVLFATSIWIYAVSPVVQMYDSRFLTAASYSLLHDGQLSVPSDLAAYDYQISIWGEKAYHKFPNAPAVLNVPLLLVFELFGVSVFEGTEQPQFDFDSEVRVLRLSAAWVTAMTVVLGYLLTRVFLSWKWSLASALVFAFGTPLFSTASRPYWSHTWGVFFLTLGLLLLLAPGLRRRRYTFILVATAISWACFCRPTFALSAIAITIVLLSTRTERTRLLLFVGSGTIWALLFVYYSTTVYGRVVPPYFTGALSFEGASPLGLVLPEGEAAVGTLLSPGRGLFVFTPIFALILFYVILYWRSLSSRPLVLAGLSVILLNWLMICNTRQWWGGGCYGPRLFVDLVPWFLLLSALATDATIRRDGSGPRKALQISVVVLASVFSIFVHTRGATAQETMEWGGKDLEWAHGSYRIPLLKAERLNNWRYPQFLAGAIPVPRPADYESVYCEGRERLRRASCRNKLRVTLSGESGARYNLSLLNARHPGQLGESGRQTLAFEDVSGSGLVTVVWDCGSVQTKSYVCSDG